MAIKRIQLRGISRTPSDRMTEDGGLAESLNVQLDENEIQPMLPPVDKTSSMSIPTNYEGEVLYIHDVVSKKIALCRVASGIGYYDEGGFTLILPLDPAVEITDISNTGNSVIVTTPGTAYYFQYRDEVYNYLGTNIPFPKLEVWDAQSEHYQGAGQANYDHISDLTRFDGDPQDEYSVSNKPDIVAALTAIYEMIESQISDYANAHTLLFPVYIRVALRLYDGSVTNVSAPILFGIGKPTDSSQSNGAQFLDIEAFQDYAMLRSPRRYKIFGKPHNVDEFNGWEDIVESVEVYATTQMYPYASMNKCRIVGDASPAVAKYIVLDPVNTIDDLTDYIDANCGPFHLLASYKLQNYKSLDETEIELSYKLSNSTWLSTQMPLEGEFRSSHVVVPGKTMVYNNRLHTWNLKQSLSHNYNFLQSATLQTLDPFPDQGRSSKYRFTYFLRGEDGNKTITSRYYSGGEILHPNIYREQFDSYEMPPAGWISYPDSRCYKVKVEVHVDDWATGYYYKEYDMKPMLTQEASFVFLGLGVDLSEDVYSENHGEYEPALPTIDEDAMENIDTKLYQSEPGNMFVFRAGGIITFNSKIVGIATITTPMSSGQFGSYDLYVFAREGVWSLSLGNDGAFVTKKPATRDCCISSESIVATEASVFFLTDKGLIRIAGLATENISPNMNGKHYQLEADAIALLTGSAWAPLLPTIADDTPFMAFMKEAHGVYDYAGNRLIFFKTDESYQYVYKLDMQTWHKMQSPALSEFSNTLNSYPEAEVVLKQTVKNVPFAYMEDGEATSVEANAIYDDLPDSIKAKRTRTEMVDWLTDDTRPYMYLGDFTEAEIEDMRIIIGYYATYPVIDYFDETYTRVFNYSTFLDVVADEATSIKGAIVTRPFDLGETDIRKVIKDLRIRGAYNAGDAKYILLGSMDGIHFGVLHSLRGGSYKLFRLVILTDLSPTERISWVDVDYETRFANKLR